MIKLFDIENNVVKPTAHCENIVWLKSIGKRWPEEKLKIFSYLFYMACSSQENPFFNLPEEEKQDTILTSIDLDFEIVEEEQVEEALKLALKLYETPTIRAYYGIKTALDNIAEFMASTQITAGKDGNITQFKGVVKDFDDMRRSFKGVAKDLEAEQQAHVRGGQNMAYDQM